MGRTLTGTLHGSTITLDTIESERGVQQPESVESRRVRVVVEPLDDVDLVLTPAQQARLLIHWAEYGPQGPIEDGGD